MPIPRLLKPLLVLAALLTIGSRPRPRPDPGSGRERLILPAAHARRGAQGDSTSPPASRSNWSRPSRTSTSRSTWRSMTIGRLWVTDTVEYPFPKPAGTPGRDSVKILSNFGPDGRAGKIQTFADGLNIPIGLLPYPSGREAIVHNIPNIYLMKDTDGDGRADVRQVLYGVIGHRDTHGMTNAFTWGFDGWIYACHGFANDSNVQGSDHRPIRMNSGNTYRIRPDGSHAEYFTHGQVNPFGLAFDPLGNMYSSDCHSRPVYQLLRGPGIPASASRTTAWVSAPRW